MCFSIEKSMAEFGDKVSDEQKETINTQIAKVREAIKNGNIDDVVSSQKELENIWNPIVSEIYKSQTPENGGDATNQFSNIFGGSGNPFAGGNFGTTNNPFAK
jgi:molecular chaperone DnaK